MSASRSKPQQGARIDWQAAARFGITKDNLPFYLVPDGPNRFRNLVNDALSNDSGAGWSARGTNKGFMAEAGTESVRVADADVNGGLAGASEMTCIWTSLFNSDPGGSATYNLFRHNGSTYTQWQGLAAYRLTWSAFISGTLRHSRAGTSAPLGVVNVQSADWYSGGPIRHWLDGALINTTANYSGTIDAATDPMCMGGTEADTEDLDGAVGIYIGIKKKLPDEARRALETDPYQLLRPVQPNLYIIPRPQASAFDGTAEIGAGEVTVQGVAPTVTTEGGSAFPQPLIAGHRNRLNRYISVR